MIDLENLASIEEIKQLKAKYFRFADTNDLVSYQALFTDDAKIDVRGAVAADESNAEPQPMSDFDKDGLIIGGAAFVEFISRVSVPGAVTVHHGHMPEIKILSATTAQGVWAMEDRVWFPTGPYRLMHGFGHYHETYEKREGVWLIASMKLVRLKIDFT